MAFLIVSLLLVAIAVVSSVTTAVFDRDEGILLGGVSMERMKRKHGKGNVWGF